MVVVSVGTFNKNSSVIAPVFRFFTPETTCPFALPAKVLLNLILTLPVYALVRRALTFATVPEGATEVRLLG